MRITVDGSNLTVDTPQGPELHSFATPEEAAAKAAVIDEALTWVGTPFVDCADVKGPNGAVDCAMLMTRCAVDTGLLAPFDPRPYPPRWHVHRDEERFVAWIESLGATEVTEPRVGDIAVWQFGRTYSHGGILIGGNMVVHAYAANRMVIVTRLDEPYLSQVAVFAAVRPRPVRHFDLWERARVSGLFGSHSPVNKPIIYGGLNVSTSQWNLPVTIFWGQRRLSTNAIDYDGFQKHQQSGKGGAGGGKGGGGKGGTQYTYSADALLGLCEGSIDSISNVWASGSTTTTTSLAALNMTLFSGTIGQAPWSYWSTKYPAKALGYSQTAYLGATNLDLGSSASIPDNGFECVRSAGFSYTHTTGGWINPTTHDQGTAIDVLLSDVIPDLLTRPQYGLGWSSGDIGSVSQYAAYCRAQGLFFSPLLNDQTKCTDVINRWAQLSNSWIYWSGTQLQFVPMGDEAVTGNGVTYTPQNDVAYELTLDDLIAGEGEPPVQVSRKDPADCYNTTSVSITDRTLGYISNPIEYKDDQLVDRYGRRDNTSVQADDCCDPAVGHIVAQLVGKQAAYDRNTYKFTTWGRFILCLPGTILIIPLNMTGQTVRVRVVSIEGADSGQLSFTCKKAPGTIGIYVPPAGTDAAGPSAFPDQYAVPPNVNPPAVIEPPASFTGGTQKLILAASGDGDWGGCNVWLSFDGTAYRQIGTINGPAAQGVLTATLSSFGSTNPDTAHTLSVDCTESTTTPMPVTHADADALRTIALITAPPTGSGLSQTIANTGEILAFGDVAATGSYTANLTYLQRGQYGTPAGAHSIGDRFTVVDPLADNQTSVSFDLPAAYVGQTLYVKLASFNLFGKAGQDLADCVEYSYTPVGAAAPDAGDWALEAIALGNGGANTPALLINGSPPDYITGWVVAVRTVPALLNEDGSVQLNEDGSPRLAEGDPGPWNADTVQPPSATTRTITNGIANNGVYEVSISYQVGDQISPALILGPVLAGDLTVATGAHLVRSYSTPYPVTANDTAILIAATTAQIDDGRTITVTGANLSGLASGTTYGVFYRITPNDLVASLQPSLTEMGSNDNVWFGWTTTTTGGSPTPGTPPPPTYGGTDPNCVTDDTLILMANSGRDGPGVSKPAASVITGDWVWTRPELDGATLGAWGAHEVTAITFADEPVFAAPEHPRATPRHRFWYGRWVMMEEIGVAAGSARVAKISVASARTYVAAGVISHNIKEAI